MIYRDTEAIILTTREHGESDRLITFLAGTGEVLTGMAKGARRSRRRFVHALEPYSLVELRYRERCSHSLVWIEACKLLEPHLELREDLQRWGYAALLAEITRELTPERVAHQELFQLVVQALPRLATGKDPLNALVLALVRLLQHLGYLGSFAACSLCQKPVRSSFQWWLNMARGVLACHQHQVADRKFIPVDLGTLLLLQEAKQIALDKLWRLKIRHEMQEALLSALLDLARRQLEKDLQSLKLLRQIL